MAPKGKQREYEVELILDHDDFRNYLVKWVKYKRPTWEPIENLTNCKEALREYRDRYISRTLQIQVDWPENPDEPEVSMAPKPLDAPGKAEASGTPRVPEEAAEDSADALFV